MIASLPMYDRPEAQAANDALWSAVRKHLGYGPATLTRDLAYDATWGRDDLVLGHICNLPYRARFRDQVTPIASGDHQLDDTPAGYYHSVFIARKTDAARGLAPATLGVFAYNDALSQSGWGAAVTRIHERGLTFHSTLPTGSHIDSARAVADGRADLAAIDAVTWRQMSLWDPVTQDLAVVDRTGLSPSITFVTAKAYDPAPILDALTQAIAGLDHRHKDALSLYGLRVLAPSAFDIALPPSPANPLQSAQN